MKLFWNNIFDHLRQVVFIAIVMSMITQPVLQSISYIFENDIKLVQVELDEDSDEETTEDNKEEKIEFQIQKIHTRFSENAMITSSFFKEERLSNMSIEILVPPPKNS